MFVDIVLHHWFLTLIYVVVGVRIAWRFQLDVVRNFNWIVRLNNRIYDLPTPFKVAGMIVEVLACLSVSTLIFPVLWVSLTFAEARKKKLREAEFKQQAEEARIAQEKKDQENLRRAEARKQWFAEHPPRLYFKTVSGITAILRPADYEYALKDTRAARLNGFWEKDGTLRIYCETRIFVTKQGEELIKKNLHLDSARYEITGYVSQLHEVVEEGKIELVLADDIFVPWVNESILSFGEQKNFMRSRSSNFCSLEELVDKQAPADLQHVR
jgi:hypothetical protein